MVSPDFFLMGSSATCQFPMFGASSQDLVEIFNRAVRLESEREKVRRVPRSSSVARQLRTADRTACNVENSDQVNHEPPVAVAVQVLMSFD